MSERENTLARIREALQLPSPAPGHHGNRMQRQLSAPTLRQILPRVGNTSEERLELFKKTATDLRAEFRVVTGLPEAQAMLREISNVERWSRIAFHAGTLTDSICSSLSLPVCRTDRTYDVRELETCSAGISECDALVAQTGSVLVTSRSAGGRALSVLPPHHVVLARASQLVADLPEALALVKEKYAPAYPSFISFITGPSRTGDIERILVLGAHGPRKLTIILLQSL
jgi:L-lactate dehydrogenase complex protein LldG